MTNGSNPNIKVLSGFTTDPLENNLSTVTFRNSGIKRLTITYGSGSDVRNGTLTTQGIYLSGLTWSNIVPVQLIYFRGKSEGNRVRLNWATATEINSEYFYVERSTDLKQFDAIGKITSAGDSRKRIEYSFLDESPLPGVNYYRLKQVDRDGTSEFSKIIAVSPQNAGARLVVYPNPSDGTNIKVQFDDLELEALRLVNILGQEIPFEIEANTTNGLTIMPKGLLENGIYFITYLSPEKGRVTQKLLINR
ncbi:MAG: T9SS type A sorting domain-containing protein [Spirosomataceae bacterium]